MFLLHHLRHCAQLLVDKFICCGHHKYFLSYSQGHKQECIWSRPVSFFSFQSESHFLIICSLGPVLDEEEDGYALEDVHASRVSWIKRVYDRTRWIWILFALCEVALQATRSTDSSGTHLEIIDWGELALTGAFDVDIVWRFLSFLPNWRPFFDHGNNWLDLVLAVGSSIIQIPAIRNSEIYPWLTIFQLTRFYRVILEVPRMRPLLVSAVTHQ